MKIVVLDGYTLNPGDISWEGMEAFGELTVYDRTKAEDVVARIGDAEVVYTNKTPITRETLDACPNVKFIGVLATGYNIVDIAAAKEKASGIQHPDLRDGGCLPVRHRTSPGAVPPHRRALRRGEGRRVDEQSGLVLLEISSRGAGRQDNGHHRLRPHRAGHGQDRPGLGMKVLAYDAFKRPELETETCHYVDLDTLLAESDVIALHCPLFPDTEGIINKDTIAKMKDGVMIINNSRGPLVVEQDLRDALDSGKVAGAAVDVVSTEPIRMDNPLIGAKNVIITPHISWARRSQGRG